MNLSGLAGLANVYPGYLSTQRQQNLVGLGDLELENAKQANIGKSALADALALIGGGSAGMAPTAPLPPMPGQPSQPAGPPTGGLPPLAGPPGGMPPPGGEEVPLPTPGPMRPMPPGGMPPMPGQPSMPAAPPGLPPPAAGMAPKPPGMTGQPVGSLDWRTLVKAIQQTHPELDGRGVFEAVSQAMPLMNSSAQHEWRSLQLQMQEYRIDEQRRRLETDITAKGERQEKGLRSRAEIAAANNAAKLDRLNISIEGRQALKQMSIEAQAEIAEMIDKGKTGRAELSADTKRELQGLNADLRREITDTLERGRTERQKTDIEAKGVRQEKEITAKGERTDKTIAAQNQRAADTEAGRAQRHAEREARIEKYAQLRSDRQYQQLQEQIEARKQRVIASEGRQGLGELRAAMDAAYRYTTSKIQAQSEIHGLGDKEKAALLLDIRRNLDATLEELRTRFGRSTPGATPTAPAAPGAPKAGGQVPALPPGAPGVPGAAGAAEPEAIPVPPGYKNLPDGSVLSKPGDNRRWVKQGDQLIAE